MPLSPQAHGVMSPAIVLLTLTEVLRDLVKPDSEYPLMLFRDLSSTQFFQNPKATCQFTGVAVITIASGAIADTLISMLGSLGLIHMIFWIRVLSYRKIITLWEPKGRATMSHASDFCAHCGSYKRFSKCGPLCSGVLFPEQVLWSPQGYGPARNTVSLRVTFIANPLSRREFLG